jgi:hypothetical protein
LTRAKYGLVILGNPKGIQFSIRLTFSVEQTSTMAPSVGPLQGERYASRRTIKQLANLARPTLSTPSSASSPGTSHHDHAKCRRFSLWLLALRHTLQ